MITRSSTMAAAILLLCASAYAQPPAAEPYISRIASAAVETQGPAGTPTIRATRDGTTVEVVLTNFGWYCGQPPTFSVRRVGDRLEIFAIVPHVIPRCPGMWNLRLRISGGETAREVLLLDSNGNPSLRATIQPRPTAQ